MVRANDPGMQGLHLENDIQQRLALLEEAEGASEVHVWVPNTSFTLLS